jgi:hypothetical protein
MATIFQQATEEDHETPITDTYEHEASVRSNGTHRGLLSRKHPASAASISFSEDPNESAPIAVTTDITNPTISRSLESASLSLGNVTGVSTLLFRRQMTNMGTMTGEGGGNGVSDVLSLFSFVSGDVVVGFLATFQSDGVAVAAR